MGCFMSAQCVFSTPWWVGEILGKSCRLVRSWNSFLWPPGTQMRVIAVRFDGKDWFVELEVVELEHMERIWDIDPDVPPTITVLCSVR